MRLAKVAKTGKMRFVILVDDDGVEYFAAFGGFRQPVKGAKGVEFALPAGHLKGFTVGQRVLIHTIKEPSEAMVAAAKKAGKPKPNLIAQQWSLISEHDVLFVAPQ